MTLTRRRARTGGHPVRGPAPIGRRPPRPAARSPAPGRADRSTPPAPASVGRTARRGPAAASYTSPGAPRTASRWRSKRHAGRWHPPRRPSGPAEETRVTGLQAPFPGWRAVTRKLSLYPPRSPGSEAKPAPKQRPDWLSVWADVSGTGHG